jgi:hypothetical protein
MNIWIAVERNGKLDSRAGCTFPANGWGAFMILRKLAVVAVLAVATSGCASIVKGSSETLTINTVPATGAVCTLVNGRGTWRVHAPGRIRVKRSDEDMGVTCRAQGYADASGTISSDFQTWALGNVLVGGLVGLAVDWSTGAINDYERHFELPMYPSQGYRPPEMRTSVLAPSS